jgi:hypothetical protein
MAKSQPKAVYTRDQRILTLVIYADAQGHTSAVLDWKEALAGEQAYRRRELKRMVWPSPINQPEHALWCLVQIAKRLTVTRDPKE